MNQTATVSHQVKCQSTKTIKVRLPPPSSSTSAACGNSASLPNLAAGVRVQRVSLSGRRSSSSELGFCAPRLHWARLRRELRSFTDGSVGWGASRWRSELISFRSRRLLFGFPAREMFLKGVIWTIGWRISCSSLGLRDSPLALVLFLSCG